MARIRSFRPDPTAARPPRTDVDCTHSIVYTANGTKLLRLATLGSDERKSEPKPSQIIELDEESAAKLLEIIKDTFPRLRS
nr:hypothetical protein [Mycolicibacterium komanii]CRL70038.1 hypothetical protein CPGR_01813 [Mycolicibacterium komanii]